MTHSPTNTPTDLNIIHTNSGIFLVLLLIGGFLLRRDGLDDEDKNPAVLYPEYATRGAMKEGFEWIEYPAGSGNLFYRNRSTGQWVKND